MYEELIKRLRNRANGSYEEKCEGCEFTEDFPPCVHCTIKAFNDAADAIEELSKPKWIPVTERLPEEQKIVLCYCSRNGEYGCGEVVKNDRNTLYWIGLNGLIPTHWQPLPEPPKEET